MKIETFQTLQAVIATGSMARAAQQLHLTPGAVSMQVKQLEEYMGVALFDRSRHAVQPKPQALELGALAGAFMQQLDALRQRSTIEVQGTVRLGVLDTLLPLLLPSTLARLERKHPMLRIELVHGKGRFLLEQVRAAGVDMAIVPHNETDSISRGVHWQPLMCTPFVLIAPPGSTAPVAQLLQQHRLIAYDRNTTSGALAARYLREVHGVTKADLEFDSLPAIVPMVSLGMGVAVLQIINPRLLKTDPVEVHDLGNAGPQMRYGLLMRQELAEHRNVRAVAQVLEELVRELELALPPEPLGD
jgi:DNA-binding transcriptional LysR family regulator